MKKILLAAAFLFTLSMATMARSNKGVDAQTIAAFNKDFAGATSISWQQEENFTKASFTLNGNVLFAYYAPGGDLIATTRNISSSQLPMVLLNSIKTEYGSFWITDLFEMATNNTTSYYITLENAGEKKILHSNGLSWEMFDNIVKE